MIAAVLAGAAAGYGIAIPLGAVGILIIETGLTHGFWLAFAAGAGAAAADGIYATVAALFGAALADVLAPIGVPLRMAAVVILVAIAVRGIRGLRAGSGGGGSAAEAPAGPGQVGAGAPVPLAIEAAERSGSARRTFGTFLGITLLNPVTIAYFAALIVGLTATGAGPLEKGAFVAGAVGASLSWQTILAAVGAFLHRRVSSRLRTGVVLLGNAIVLAFAVVIGAGLLA